MGHKQRELHSSMLHTFIPIHTHTCVFVCLSVSVYTRTHQQVGHKRFELHGSVWRRHARGSGAGFLICVLICVFMCVLMCAPICVLTCALSCVAMACVRTWSSNTFSEELYVCVLTCAAICVQICLAHILRSTFNPKHQNLNVCPYFCPYT